MIKGILQTAICIFSLIMALAYIPASPKVSICMAVVFLINTNGLLAKFIKFVIPWKIRLALSVLMVLAAVSIAPRSREYSEAAIQNTSERVASAKTNQLDRAEYNHKEGSKTIYDI